MVQPAEELVRHSFQRAILSNTDAAVAAPQDDNAIVVFELKILQVTNDTGVS